MDWLVYVVGPLLGWAVQHVIGKRQWSKVRKVATEIIAEDESPDIERAVARAMIKVHADRLNVEAQKVLKAFTPTGKMIPKLDIVVTEDTESDKKSP